MIKSQPKASGMAKKKEGKNKGKGDPQNELLKERDVQEVIQNKIAGYGNHNSCRIVDIHGPHEVTLLALKF